MEKLFEIPLLDDLYDARCEELENEYAEKYGVPEQREKFNKVHDKFVDILNSFSNNPADEKKLFDGFNEYTRWARHDSEFWRKQNYKQGIGDCICLIRELIQVFNIKEIPNARSSIFNKIILDFLTYISTNNNKYKTEIENDPLIIELNERIKELESEILDCIDTHMEADNRDHIMKLIEKKNEKINKLEKRKEEITNQFISKRISTLQ